MKDAYYSFLQTPVLHCFIIAFFILHLVIRYQGSWCQNQGLGKDTVFPHLPSHRQHQYQKHEMIIKEEHRKLEKWEQRIRRLETELRRRYPEEVQGIMHLARPDMPWIYAITPTYARPVQKAELTRLAQTFLHVNNFHWIVVEDAFNKTKLVRDLLLRSGLSHTHLNVGTPPEYKMSSKDPNWLKPRGVLQRNAALDWIRNNKIASRDKGVVYFADDDNTYDLQLFEEMRFTRRVSVWPVGLVGYLRYESPVVQNGRVTHFFTSWKPERPFPIDMAGFAINLGLLLNRPEANFNLEVPRGYQESTLLSKLVTRDQVEPLADNCSKVLVWHTRTEKPSLKNEAKLRARGLPGSDPKIEI